MANDYPPAYWGLDGKDWRLKRFVEHQEREATRTREATEQIAQHAALQTAMQMEALQQQLDAQQAAQAQANKQQLAPDVLFDLCEEQPMIIKSCNEFLNVLQQPACKSALPTEVVSGVLRIADRLKWHSRTVFGLDSSYLSDFSQKKALKDIRTELLPLIERWNRSLTGPIRQLLASLVMSKRYVAATRVTKSQLDNYFSLFDRMTKAEWTYLQRSQKKWPLLGVITVMAGIITFAAWAFLFYVMVPGATGDEGGGYVNMILMGLFVPPILITLVIRFIWNMCHDPSSGQAVAARLEQQLNAVYPLKDSECLRVVQDELRWQGDEWALNEKGKATVSKEVEAIWMVPEGPKPSDTDVVSSQESDQKIEDTDIVFDCPFCGKRMAIDPKGAGLTIACAECGKHIVVPTPEGQPG